VTRTPEEEVAIFKAMKRIATEPVQRAIDWYAAGCPPWRQPGAWGDCDACLVYGAGELVPLVDGVCPRCRTDWRTDAQKSLKETR
jgi:hypothetical protein